MSRPTPAVARAAASAAPAAHHPDRRRDVVRLTPIGSSGGLAEPQPSRQPPPPARHARWGAAMHRRGWTLVLLPQSPGAVRSYELRRWQLRLAGGALLALLAGALVGGAALDARSHGEDLATIDQQLWDAQLSIDALGDTLAAMRLAAVVNAAAPTVEASRGAGSKGITRRAATLPRLASGVVLPVFGRIGSPFARARRHPILRISRPHLGLDIVAPAGTRIRAPADGRVRRVTRQFGYGLLVELDHGGGVITRYAHGRAALVAVGDRVTRGAPIATVGSSGLATGPHLHYEVLVRGRQVDPMRHPFPAPPVPAARATPDAGSGTTGMTAPGTLPAP